MVKNQVIYGGAFLCSRVFLGYWWIPSCFVLQEACRTLTCLPINLAPHSSVMQIPEYVSVQLRGGYQSFRTETCVLMMRHACIKFFYRHELLQQYRYYWRVEPGVKYFCDMDYDPFEMFEKENKVYGKLFYLQDLMPNHYIIRVLTTPINLSTTFFRILWQRDIFYWLLAFPFCNVTFRIYNLSIRMAADNSNTMGHSKGIHERSSRTRCTG